MASVVYTNAKAKLMDGTIDMDADDIRVSLHKTTSTVLTDEDTALMNAFGTLAELTDGSYVRKALATEAVNIDNTNDRAEFDADDVTWSALAGAETIIAAVVYKHITTDADSIPICGIDVADLVTNGSDVTLQWNVEGILQLT